MFLGELTYRTRTRTIGILLEGTAVPCCGCANGAAEANAWPRYVSSWPLAEGLAVSRATIGVCLHVSGCNIVASEHHKYTI